MNKVLEAVWNVMDCKDSYDADREEFNRTGGWDNCTGDDVVYDNLRDAQEVAEKLVKAFCKKYFVKVDSSSIKERFIDDENNIYEIRDGYFAVCSDDYDFTMRNICNETSVNQVNGI